MSQVAPAPLPVKTLASSTSSPKPKLVKRASLSRLQKRNSGSHRVARRRESSIAAGLDNGQPSVWRSAITRVMRMTAARDAKKHRTESLRDVAMLQRTSELQLQRLAQVPMLQRVLAPGERYWWDCIVAICCTWTLFATPAQFFFFFQFRGELWIGCVLLLDIVINASTAYEVRVTDLTDDDAEPEPNPKPTPNPSDNGDDNAKSKGTVDEHGGEEKTGMGAGGGDEAKKADDASPLSKKKNLGRRRGSSFVIPPEELDAIEKQIHNADAVLFNDTLVTLEWSRLVVAQRYILSWSFVFDIVSVTDLLRFDDDFVNMKLWTTFGERAHVHTVLAIATLFRLHRLPRTVGRLGILEGWTGLSLHLQRLFVNLALCFYFSFLMGCLFFWVSSIQGEEVAQLADSWISQCEFDNSCNHNTKVISMVYWGLTTLTTVGYGDITPQTDLEMVAVSVMLVFSVVIYSAIFGATDTVIKAIREKSVMRSAHLEQVQAFMALTLDDRTIMSGLGAPSSLAGQAAARLDAAEFKDKVMRYARKKFEAEQGLNFQAIIRSFPLHLQREIQFRRFGALIRNVKLFRSCSLALVQEITFLIREGVVLGGDFLVRVGEIAHEMYFLQTGRVAIIARDGELITVLNPGSYFGEIAILNRTVRTASVRAVTECRIFTLSKFDLDQILDRFPEDAATLKQQQRKYTRMSVMLRHAPEVASSYSLALKKKDSGKQKKKSFADTAHVEDAIARVRNMAAEEEAGARAERDKKRRRAAAAAPGGGGGGGGGDRGRGGTGAGSSDESPRAEVRARAEAAILSRRNNLYMRQSELERQLAQVDLELAELADETTVMMSDDRRRAAAEAAMAVAAMPAIHVEQQGKKDEEAAEKRDGGSGGDAAAAAAASKGPPSHVG